MATRDGGAIRPRALVRSGNLDALTPAGIAAMASYGVRRVIDVRGAWEYENFPSPFQSEPTYWHVPIGEVDVPGEIGDLAEMYRLLLDGCASGFGAAVGAIADAPDGVVVVHCHAGKDRTGVVIALALAAVGATDEAIAADYASSERDVRSVRIVEDYLATVPDAERAQRRSWTRSPAGVMRATLSHLDATYGGVEPYLCGPGGLVADRIDRLRARLLG